LDIVEFIMESVKLKLKPRPSHNSILEDLVDIDMGLDTMVLDVEEFIMESVMLKLSPNSIQEGLVHGYGLRH
jgi:hypothetical protein